MKLAFAVAILLARGLCVSAKPTTFKNSGLKTETVITLDLQGKRVTGTFESSEYGENSVTQAFTGEVIPIRKGKSRVYMKINFSGKVPYSPPPKAKALRWSLRDRESSRHISSFPWRSGATPARRPSW
jgi:hypothetical protein